MIKLAGAQGYYGDSHAPLADLLSEEPDFIVAEALAELTLAILQKDRQRDSSLGYTRDLPLYLKDIMPAIVGGKTRFITNAGESIQRGRRPRSRTWQGVSASAESRLRSSQAMASGTTTRSCARQPAAYVISTRACRAT